MSGEKSRSIRISQHKNYVVYVYVIVYFPFGENFVIAESLPRRDDNIECISGTGSIK